MEVDRDHFEFRGKIYKYFSHPYNFAGENERTVEIPIIWEEIQSRPNARILEVGNVLSHYYEIKHTVVDLYEKAPGVINEDIIKYNPPHKFDLIVSISTMEHVNDFKAGIDALIRLADDNGIIFVTLPMGWRPGLKEILERKEIPWTEERGMKRISNNPNLWKEVEAEEVYPLTCNKVYPWAHGILIGAIKKSKKEII